MTAAKEETRPQVYRKRRKVSQISSNQWEKPEADGLVECRNYMNTFVS